MKLTIILALCAFPFLLSAQSLILKGKILGEDLPSNRIIYVVQNEDAISVKNSFNYEPNFEYEYKVSLNEIKKEQISTLSFTTDIECNPKDKYACVYKVNIEKNLNNANFDSNQNQIFYTDLFVTENCIFDLDLQIYATDDGLGDYIGEYLYINDSTKGTILLNNDFSCELIYSRPDTKKMSKS